jgi:hypothetical protein
MPVFHVSFDLTPALLAAAMAWDAILVAAAVAVFRRRRRPLLPSRG